MRITESHLRSVIKQELIRLLNEVNTPAADEYFKQVLTYLNQKGGIADKADFSYINEEAQKKGMEPIPPYSNDSNIRQILLRGRESDTNPFYSLVLNPKETDESKIQIVNFYTYYDRNIGKNIVKAIKTTKSDIRKKYV